MKKFLILLSFIILFTTIIINKQFIYKNKPINVFLVQSYHKTNILKDNLIDNKNIRNNNGKTTFNYAFCENIFELVISNKKFLCFFPNSCYDQKSFVYNEHTDTYSADYMYEQDPAGDLDYPLSKCPYDSGYITHLIFNITFSPSKNIFKAKYKGFVSSINVENKKNGDSYNKFLNIYYDTNPRLIYGLKRDIEYFQNKNVTSDSIFIDTFTSELKCIYNRIKS